MDYYSVIEKKKVLPFSAMQMDLQNIMLSEYRILFLVKCQRNAYTISLTHKI